MISYFQQYFEHMLKEHLPMPLQIIPAKIDDFDLQSPIFFRTTVDQEKAIIKLLSDHSWVERVEKTGKGFLNIALSKQTMPEILSQWLLSQSQEIKNCHANKQTIVIDYGGMNVAKKLHIGHIRSLFIGDFLARFYRSLGQNVIAQNHIGDWGNQFGYLIEYAFEQPYPAQNNEELTRWYRFAKLKYEADDHFADRSHERLNLLQNKDPQTLSYWAHMREMSLEDVKQICQNLDIGLSDEDVCGESFYANRLDDIIVQLIKAGVATKDADGSILVHFEQEGLSPLMLRKASGGYLYGAFDLAALQYRKETFNPDRVIYVVDSRQSLHFQQIFTVAQKMGWFNASQLEHVAFGAIFGENKKLIKTRSGDTLYLEDLLEQGFEAYKNTDAGQKNDVVDQEGMAKKTVIGALKYYDLHLRPSDNYIFRWSDVLSTQGKSAPYIQNALVRLDSILLKLGIQFSSTILSPPGTYQEYLSQLSALELSQCAMSEWSTLSHQLLKKIMYLSEASFSAYSPSFIQGLLEITKSFHAFYEHEKILTHPLQEDMKKLLSATGLSLLYGLSVLGISAFPCRDYLLSKKMTSSVK